MARECPLLGELFLGEVYQGLMLWRKRVKGFGVIVGGVEVIRLAEGFGKVRLTIASSFIIKVIIINKAITIIITTIIKQIIA